MTNEQLKEKLLQVFPTAVISETTQYVIISVEPDQLHQVATTLKENKELHFDFLFCQSGTDVKEALGVSYFLESTDLRHHLLLKVSTTNRENPVLDTVCDIWETANFNEREVYDMYGITFRNHPDMRRMFLDEEDWVGYPLRKDYVDEVNIIERN